MALGMNSKEDGEVLGSLVWSTGEAAAHAVERLSEPRCSEGLAAIQKIRETLPKMSADQPSDAAKQMDDAVLFLGKLYLDLARADDFVLYPSGFMLAEICGAIKDHLDAINRYLRQLGYQEKTMPYSDPFDKVAEDFVNLTRQLTKAEEEQKETRNKEGGLDQQTTC
jgi:hypothetical protein